MDIWEVRTAWSQWPLRVRRMLLETFPRRTGWHAIVAIVAIVAAMGWCCDNHGLELHLWQTLVRASVWFGGYNHEC